MSYKKHNFKDGDTLSAEQLNAMDSALEELVNRSPSVGLPAPANAKPGQFIAVAAVDENGHVTATVAVDPPAGGGCGMSLSRPLRSGYIMAGNVSLSAEIPEEEEAV